MSDGDNDTTNTPISYSIQVQAPNLFKFLKDTFFRMPRAVQVLGWLVFLALFVFLVLYPIVGITYYQGRVITLTKKKAQKLQQPASGVRVHWESHTYTNDNGEFTIAVRAPYIPFVDIEFELGAGDYREFVELPRPLPFVSLFDPNQLKIYHVPASLHEDELGTVRHFFLEAHEAAEAFREAHAKTGETASAASKLLRELVGSGVAQAAEHPYQIPTYTLRLKEIELLAGTDISEVYFDIRLNGKPIAPEGIPSRRSPKIERLTVFPGVNLISGMDIPIHSRSSAVEITVMRAGGWSDTALGTLKLALRDAEVGPSVRVPGGSIAISAKLLPPLAIRYVSLPNSEGASLAIFWIDSDRLHLETIEEVHFDRGPSFDDAYELITARELAYDDPLFYAAALTNAPFTLRAKVVLHGGEALRLTRQIMLDHNEPRSAVGHAMAAYGLRLSGQLEQALTEAERAIEENPALITPLLNKSKVLAEFKRFGEAKASYEKLVEMAPNSANVLNGYAWMLLEQLPDPSRADLKRARELASRSVYLRASPEHLDTLGWAHFKLDEFEEALAVLKRALRLAQVQGLGSNTWVEIQYHLGHVYLRREEFELADLAFKEVVDGAVFLPGLVHIEELRRVAAEERKKIGGRGG